MENYLLIIEDNEYCCTYMHSIKLFNTIDQLKESINPERVRDTELIPFKIVETITYEEFLEGKCNSLKDNERLIFIYKNEEEKCHNNCDVCIESEVLDIFEDYYGEALRNNDKKYNRKYAKFYKVEDIDVWFRSFRYGLFYNSKQS